MWRGLRVPSAQLARAPSEQMRDTQWRKGSSPEGAGREKGRRHHNNCHTRNKTKHRGAWARPDGAASAFTTQQPFHTTRLWVWRRADDRQGAPEDRQRGATGRGGRQNFLREMRNICHAAVSRQLWSQSSAQLFCTVSASSSIFRR